MIGNQIDRRAPKTAAGEARAETTTMRPGQRHQRVQFFRAVAQRITRAVIALELVFTELTLFVCAQRCFGGHVAGDFTDNVIRTSILAQAELGALRLKMLEFHRPQ